MLEASQIKANTPKYNILLKDDKGYSYIKITKEEWPRLSFVLQKEDDGAEYLGPYTSSFAARQMAETAMDAFLLPRCQRLKLTLADDNVERIGVGDHLADFVVVGHTLPEILADPDAEPLGLADIDDGVGFIPDNINTG